MGLEWDNYGQMTKCGMTSTFPEVVVLFIPGSKLPAITYDQAYTSNKKNIPFTNYLGAKFTSSHHLHLHHHHPIIPSSHHHPPPPHPISREILYPISQKFTSDIGRKIRVNFRSGDGMAEFSGAVCSGKAPEHLQRRSALPTGDGEEVTDRAAQQRGINGAVFLLLGGLEHEFYDFPYLGNVITPIDF